MSETILHDFDGKYNHFFLVILGQIEYNKNDTMEGNVIEQTMCRPRRHGKGSASMKVQTSKGMITISNDVFTNITGAAATNCYGVKGMAVRSTTDGLVHLLRLESMSKGVKVTYNDDKTISLELHIIVENGVNLKAVSRAIMSEVRYNVSRLTGVSVRNVDVFVDSMVVG